MSSTNPAREELRAALKHDMAAFLEAGGAVQEVPFGVSGLPPGDGTNTFLFDIGRAPAAPKKSEP